MYIYLYCLLLVEYRLLPIWWAAHVDVLEGVEVREDGGADGNGCVADVHDAQAVVLNKEWHHGAPGRSKMDDKIGI